MVVSLILTISYCIVMIIAAHYESLAVILLSNVLIIPAFVIMVCVTIYNWRKSNEVYPTFEEITKVDLERYFHRVNSGYFKKKGVEFGIAQLGHFWVECRILNP